MFDVLFSDSLTNQDSQWCLSLHAYSTLALLPGGLFPSIKKHLLNAYYILDAEVMKMNGLIPACQELEN